MQKVRRAGLSLFILHSAFCILHCSREAAVPPPAPARETIEVAYVGAPELAVHSKADDNSPVVTKFLNGESVSVLAKKGDWVEVRTTDGSGWAHAADLTNAAGAKAEEANPTPRFRKPPSPISEPGAHGTVYIEAAVNTDGDVTHTQLITNTTGSALLAEKNEAALKQSKFYPIVQKGEKKDFLYYYRVDY
ncbi:MAG TPA: SH3 domain-containing protein [Thermoanaerobaculia bacterium]